MPATSKLSHNHADTRTEGGLRSPAMSYSRHTPSKHPCKSCCVCQLRPHGRQRRLQRKMSTIQVQSVIAALQLPNVCHARATTGCPTRCRCRCQPRSESSAHAAAAGLAGRDANLCHAVCDGGQYRFDHGGGPNCRAQRGLGKNGRQLAGRGRHSDARTHAQAPEAAALLGNAIALDRLRWWPMDDSDGKDVN